MDSRAKQRLTGAVILVALFVLLVPELLTGPQDSATAPPADDGLRRYTIDLDAPGSAGVQAAPSEPAVTLPAVAAAPRAGNEQLAQPGEAASTAEPLPEPAEPVRPAVANSPAPAARTPPATIPARGSFVVQLGSFGSKENADRLVSDMTARGFTTFISPITTNGRELYRVRVGPTRDRASAEALAAQLKRVGQSGSIVPIS